MERLLPGCFGDIMNNKIKLNTLAFITIIFWSAAYPLTKVASQDFDCYTITALRAVYRCSCNADHWFGNAYKKIFKFSSCLVVCDRGCIRFFAICDSV